MTRAKKQAPPAPTDPRGAMGALIGRLAHRHHSWNVFSDFVEMSAISVSNAVDLAQRDGREVRYAEIIKRYTPDELALFPQMLAALVDALEETFDDVLGRVFHDLELHNKWAGQFFSPYALARTLAEVTIGDRSEIDTALKVKGYITAMEPASGGGAMMIALAETLKAAGINYQQVLHVTAVDVDAKCVHMTYLQLTLLGVPAIVIHGNSLTLETHGYWRTPMHMLGGWEWRLARDRARVTTEPTAPVIVASESAPMARRLVAQPTLFDLEDSAA